MEFEVSENINKTIFLRLKNSFDPSIDKIYMQVTTYVPYHDGHSYQYNAIFTFILFPNFINFLSQYLFIEIKNSNLDPIAQRYLINSNKEIIDILHKYYNNFIGVNGL